ncbi:hypothetical protein [Saccharolobus caldissimus]|uniref:Uncharacterized protein n=1 Tax=Saccharolobus caldissimus TaxID=1702097 RepID=A0AAQ4CRD4_9CREN|nr:hypothetical protein [Saccharolobus caldissimus]BDB98365.1 hypothetical protein SACC_13820 [Saccharolobus caldissimus]
MKINPLIPILLGIVLPLIVLLGLGMTPLIAHSLSSISHTISSTAYNQWNCNCNDMQNMMQNCM